MNNEAMERRRYPRSRRSVRVVHDESGPGLLNHVDNISAAGVLCHTVKPVPLMTKIAMIFELPKPAPMRVAAEGVVVRCDPDELGDDKFRVAILFTHVSPDDEEAIHQFVKADLEEE